MTISRPLRLLAAAVRLLRIGNFLMLCLVAAGLIGAIVGGDHALIHLSFVYHGQAAAHGTAQFMQAMLAIAVVAIFAVERLLRALEAVAASVGRGDPFHAANASRLRAIGISLLLLQLLDLGTGIVTLAMRHMQAGTLDWQPNFTGWIAVLVAFVLARVFREGAAMRADLEGTV